MLDVRFRHWQSTRTNDFQATKAGQIPPWSGGDREVAVGYWPGRVDTYFDLSVSGVWNIYRAMRLLLLILLAELSESSGNDSKIGNEYAVTTSGQVMEEMIASIPYHLADNLQAFLAEPGTRSEIGDSGKHLGGLLLMHPVYVASQVPFAPVEVRLYMLRTLRWIGSQMGIGLASLMADVSMS